MAEDKNRKKDTEEDSESSKSAPEKKSKGGMGIMLPMMIVCIIIGLAGLGLGGYYLFNNMQAAKAATEENPEGDTPQGDTPTETNIYYEEFPEGIVNLAVVEDSMFTYLKYGLSMEVDSEATIEEIGTKLPRLTSRVSGIMSNRSWAEISTLNGREQLAREVKTGINEELVEGECIGIYFTTFVAQ
jgi:flagellar FliL protein